MSQLSLGIRQAYPYHPESFVLHEGVADVFEHVVKTCTRGQYRLILVDGEARSGKSHFILKLAATSRALGFFPKILVGDQCVEWMRSLDSKSLVPEDEFILVDRADEYFGGSLQLESGLFVQAIEMLRNAGVPIVFVGERIGNEAGPDDHVSSRLAEAMTYSIGNPAREDLDALVMALARQRGIEFGPRRQAYFVRRAPSSIPEIERVLERLLTLVTELGRPLNFEAIDDAF